GEVESMRQCFAELKMQNKARLVRREQELSKTAMTATEQAISRNTEALRRQGAQQERAFQHREELVHQFYAEKMQQEAQRIENHERALRHDLERQKLTYEQKIEQMNQDLRLEEQAAQVMAAQEMQRKNGIAEQIAEAQADLKREEIHQEHVIQQQTAIAANKLLEEHSTVQREREVVYQQAELQLEAQRHIQNKRDQLEAKEAGHQRATLQHQLFFNEAQALQQQIRHKNKHDQHQREQFLERYDQYEAEMHQQQQLANSEIDTDMLDGVASALTAENEKQKMQAQADNEEAYQRDNIRSALHAITPSGEFDCDVTRAPCYAELIQTATPNTAVHRGAPSSSGSSNGLTPPFYCSLRKSCGNYTSAKTEIIRCRHCGNENIEDRSVDLGYNCTHPATQ
ncbi:unnamed protein product, partial [Prorocentrum cordatum]